MTKNTFSTPHGDKLKALVNNDKLPDVDLERVKKQISIYDDWIGSMDELTSEGGAFLQKLVEQLNAYKKTVEFDLIFCSEEDFLYRQKGQLKLDNTILEEFLPRLFDERLVPGIKRVSNLECGPRASYSGLSFDSPLLGLASGGANVKVKDQDFSVTRKHHITVTQAGDPEDKFQDDIHVSYFASEIKTNLDKTMFQEGAATASELKRASSGSKYILLCEWLDMTPISSSLTAMDEVIVLRKSKRLASNVRKSFSSTKGRKENRETFEQHLNNHPLALDGFERFVHHLSKCFPDEGGDTQDETLERGYF